MVKIVVLTTSRENGVVRFKYKSFNVEKETSTAYKVVNNTGNPILEGRNVIKKSEIEKVVITGIAKSRVIIAIDTDQVVRNTIRDWYKILKVEVLKDLKERNKKLKDLFKAIDKTVI